MKINFFEYKYKDEEIRVDLQAPDGEETKKVRVIEKMKTSVDITNFAPWKFEKLINDQFVSYIHHEKFIYFFKIESVPEQAKDFTLTLL